RIQHIEEARGVAFQSKGSGALLGVPPHLPAQVWRRDELLESLAEGVHVACFDDESVATVAYHTPGVWCADHGQGRGHGFVRRRRRPLADRRKQEDVRPRVVLQHVGSRYRTYQIHVPAQLGMWLAGDADCTNEPEGGASREPPGNL